MDFLNQAIAQIRELFLSMTPAARVTAVLLVGIIGVSLGFLVQQHGASPDEYLFDGEFLESEDANRIEAAIAKKGLNDYERTGNRFKVPRGQRSAYLAAVAEDNALPANFHELLEDALDLGPFVDSKTRQERFKSAREQQLSMIIRDMDGIENARVVYDIVPARGITRKGTASATVSVQPKPGESLSHERIKQIRRAVSGAIANLNPEDVEVINLGSGEINSGEVSPETFDSPYYQHRLAFEKSMQNKIASLLHSIPGIRVQVTAELEPSLTREIHTQKVEDDPVAVSESGQTKTTETQHYNTGGRPGLFSQGPGRNNDNAPEITMKSSESSEDTELQSFIPTRNEIVTEAGLVPQHVRVAIAIPRDYLMRLFREKQIQSGQDPNQPLPADIETILTTSENTLTDKVKGVVANLLPKELAVNSFSEVAVSFFDTLTPEPTEPISMGTQALVWLGQNFSTITMAGVALVGLVMLRGLVRGLPVPEPLLTSSPTLLNLNIPSDHGSHGAEVGEVEADGTRPRLKLNKGKSLRDELTEIVREDPDSAAAILRGWINNAS